jgi:phage tail-like protein
MATNAPAAAKPAAQPGVWVDPFPAYNFKLLIQGVTEGHFTYCSGLGMEVEAIRYREGGNHQVVHAIPGRVEYTDVTLSYGLTASRTLFDWSMSGAKGKVQRKNVSIMLLDSTGATEVLRWNLFRAWISKWRAAALDALGKEVAIEQIVLVHEGLELA